MSLVGWVDQLTETCISGWAIDNADLKLELSVDVIVNSIKVATVPCVEFREDLRAAGMRDGCRGFAFEPAAYLQPGRNNLEVRITGAGLLLRGGHWVKSRPYAISTWEAAFIAAIEAYYEFSREPHICGIGAGAGELERILRQAQLPFRRFTALDVPRAPAVAQFPEKADVVVCWAYPRPSPECVRVLKSVVRDHMNQPGLLAAGFAETPDAPRQIQDAFVECGDGAVRYESLTMSPGGARRLFALAQIGHVEGAGQGRTATQPVFAHIHIPKCAGTSLRVLMTRHFGPRHLLLYVDDTYFVYGEDSLRSYLLQDLAIWGFSSHHVRAFPRWFAGREMLYVTFLRDPIQQFVSYMTHIKKYYETITSRSLLDAVPPDTPRLTLREFARWLVTNDRDIPFRENHNVNFLARHNSPAAADRLDAAKRALEQFVFVGITERMDESMSKLQAQARKAGLDFPTDPIPSENISNDYRDDLSWIHPDDEVGRLLFRSVELDRQLYDWALARL